VDRSNVDAPSAVGRLPRGDTAVGEIPIASVTRHLGIVRPAFVASDWVQRENTAQRRTQIKSPFDVDWSGLKRGGAASGGLVGVASVEGPSDLEPANVVAIDRGER